MNMVLCDKLPAHFFPQSGNTFGHYDDIRLNDALKWNQYKAALSQMEHMVLAFDGLAKQWGDAFVNWDQLHDSLCKSAQYYHPLAQVWAVLMKETKGLVLCHVARQATALMPCCRKGLCL
jgi:hypothetical protein